MANAWGYVVQRHAYWPFGEPLSAESGRATRMRYTGEQWDGDVGLVYLRARWYGPAVGRFTTSDPFPGYARRPRSQHGYVYCQNNPVKYNDPAGYTPLIPPSAPKPSIISRSEWGAMEPGIHTIYYGPDTYIRSGWAEGFYDPETNREGYAYYSDLYPDRSLADVLNTIVIHHEGNGQTYDVWEIQWKHMVGRGWTDIGYHFIVGPSGDIYEGRDIRVRGTHVSGANTGKIGILLLGDFQPGPELSICGVTVYRDRDDPGPTEYQVQSTLALIRWLDQLYSIDAVVGHRDVNAMECPGDYCMPYISLFNSAAQER